MKYIIKNCNCFILGACCSPNADRVYCKDITDCLLKRIVELCKDMASDEDSYAYDFAKEILQLLEIEEVDE